LPRVDADYVGWAEQPHPDRSRVDAIDAERNAERRKHAREFDRRRLYQVGHWESHSSATGLQTAAIERY
jgi:hypothetical protein